MLADVNNHGSLEDLYQNCSAFWMDSVHNLLSLLWSVVGSLTMQMEMKLVLLLEDGLCFREMIMKLKPIA